MGKYKRTVSADAKHAAQRERKDLCCFEKDKRMVLCYTKNGFPYREQPYTDEENREFEQRLRRGGDITIIRQRHQVASAPSQDDPEQ